MGEGPEFAKKVAYYRDKVLMEDLLGKVAKEAATDAAIQKTYDDVAKQQKPEEEVRARHILVESEADAKAALKRVKEARTSPRSPTRCRRTRLERRRARLVHQGADGAGIRRGGFQAGAWADFRPGENRSSAGTSSSSRSAGRSRSRAFDQVRDQVTRYVVQKSQSELILKLREEAKVRPNRAGETGRRGAGARTGVEGSGQSLRACILHEIGAA